MRTSLSPALVLAGVIGVAAAVHTCQRSRHHRQTLAQKRRHHGEELELGLFQAHISILRTAMTHPDLDPVWERVHPKYVKQDESGPLLMCQAWLELWRTGLNLDIYTPGLLRVNATHFMRDDLALKAWGLTRHGRASQARNDTDRLHIALLNEAYEKAGGPDLYPELEQKTVCTT
ncbi:DUF6082 family protein [Streptomyces sp. NPDC051561]|uniref:DUF6082 family protein n=1 Tax=Streptomyces sp. NPDC051561 TaxID=3365658 RepID=UPI0037B9268A